MKRYIITEMQPEQCDFSYYFDDDGLTSNSGDYLNNLFILSDYNYYRGWSGFNTEEFNSIARTAADIASDFEYVKEKTIDNDGKPLTYKRVMAEYCIEYNPRRCHDLKKWAETGGEDDAESIAEYLTITTGHKWECTSAYGYSQGDYCEIVYCPERYRYGVKQYGEIFLGCGKEFYVTDTKYEETIGGFIIADCQIKSEEDYKKLVCDWYGCPVDEAELQLIDYYYNVPHCEYKTI